MEDFDYTEQEFDEKPKGKGLDMLDIFSVLVLIATACVGAYFLLVFINPYTAFNPLPPDTPVPQFVPPTPTITPLQLDDPWTMTPTIQPTSTLTPRPTFTLIIGGFKSEFRERC
ncbi:MAG: hypothetical protein B6I38_09635 [Anaerolineaceae bacterium 4572_5.1]|nr:MAG: hypothetical protein B6I38_09635 [Anaerolineaceae bacterium 4572_5.1]